MGECSFDIFHEIQCISIWEIHVGEDDEGIQPFVNQQSSCIKQGGRQFDFPACSAVVSNQLLTQERFILDYEEGLSHS